MKKIICKRCGWEFVPRVEKPRKCPKCGSYHYDTPKEEVKNI